MFYRVPNKDEEVSASEINDITIPTGSEVEIGAVGKDSPASGAEGAFDLYDGDEKICHVYFSCPLGESGNDFQVTERPPGDGKTVMIGTWNCGSGALGSIDLLIVEVVEL